MPSRTIAVLKRIAERLHELQKANRDVSYNPLCTNAAGM